jgi:hypothetical protein
MNMIKLTFAFDCQLNENEDYVKEGQQVELYPYPIYKEGFTPVRVKEAYTFLGGKIKTDEIVWFTNASFKEYQK